MFSPGSKSSSPWEPLMDWRAKTGIVSRDQIQLTTEATHSLESQEQALSAGSNFITHHKSHSLSGEQRTGVVRRVQIWLTTEDTHPLESRGQVSLAGFKPHSPQKPLTCWRAEDRCHQQGQNSAHNGSHSLSGEPRIGTVRRAQIQFTM